MIRKNTIVTLDYTITDPDGNLLDAGAEPLVYLHGGYGDVFIPIEEALEGKSTGDSVAVKLQPAQAFGEYDPELVQLVPVADLPQPLKEGMQIEVPDEKGEGSTFVTVTDIAEGRAVIDGNHPLAGQALIFRATVADARPATRQEIEERRRH